MFPNIFFSNQATLVAYQFLIILIITTTGPPCSPNTFHRELPLSSLKSFECSLVDTDTLLWTIPSHNKQVGIGSPILRPGRIQGGQKGNTPPPRNKLISSCRISGRRRVAPQICVRVTQQAGDSLCCQVPSCVGGRLGDK